MANLILRLIMAFVLLVCLSGTQVVHPACCCGGENRVDSAAQHEDKLGKVAKEIEAICTFFRKRERTYIIGNEVRFLGRNGELIIPSGEENYSRSLRDEERPIKVIFLTSSDEDYRFEISDTTVFALVIIINSLTDKKLVLWDGADERNGEVKLDDCIQELLEQAPRMYRISIRNCNIGELLIVNGQESKIIRDIKPDNDDRIIQHPPGRIITYR